jgi:hypothetical protein
MHNAIFQETTTYKIQQIFENKHAHTHFRSRFRRLLVRIA